MIVYDKFLIGGRWRAPATDARLEVFSPATGQHVGSAPAASTGDIDAAVLAAREAFDHGPWPSLSFAERATRLARLKECLVPLADRLDRLVPSESGIPICFASGSSSFPLLDYYVELGSSYANDRRRAGRDGVTGPAIIHQAPAGVVAGIVPWNGPVMQVLMKIVPALLAGCTIVVKPAPETPLSACLLAEAVEAAGLPEGVVSIVPGGREAGEHLVRHPGVDRVSFTGSTAAGRRIAADCGAALKRVNLELGGKSAAIICEDADLDTAIPTAVGAGLFFNGEACSALTRLLVPAGRYDEIVERICTAVAALPVGDPLDPATFIGPLVSERQRSRVEDYIELGQKEGATLALGGGRPAAMTTGWYVEPTVFVDVTNSMRIAREEIFGPVLSVLACADIDEAVEVANDSEFGLGGAVFSGDLQAAAAIAGRLRTGHVGINCQGQDWLFPFGGFKQSGIGREMGIEGLELYFETQTIVLPPGSPSRPGKS